MLGYPITEPIITDQPAWFILYDGQSPDGRGQPQFCGRTTSVRIAKAHFIKCNSNPYCTGKVQVVTDREEGYIWRVEDFDQFQRAV